MFESDIIEYLVNFLQYIIFNSSYWYLIISIMFKGTGYFLFEIMPLPTGFFENFKEIFFSMNAEKLTVSICQLIQKGKLF